MTPPSVVKLARAYRDHGFNILPIGQDKRPIGGWRTWKDQKQTRDDLNAMPWKQAVGIGAVSGAVSDYRYCLDFDHVTDQELLADVEDLLGLPQDYPWSVKTPGGGAHIWVTCPELSDHIGGKGKLTGDRKGCHHVELRGRGHQTLLPGSKHPSGGIYRFAYTDAVTVPQDPPAQVEAAAVLRVAQWQQDKPRESEVAYTGNVTTIEHPWVKAALAGEQEKLSWAPEGDRNNQLNRSAMALGSLLELELSDVMAQLLPTALSIGLEERESRATIKSGFTAGRKTPRQVPESDRERSISLIWSRDDDGPTLKDAEQVQEPADEFFVDWDRFWPMDHGSEDWVFPDVLARGRGHALYASSKAGKSLLTLYMAAKVASSDTGCVVLYLDYEMTPADVHERLTDMGYGPEKDLSRLRYAMLPTLPPLDSHEGAMALMEKVAEEQSRWPDHHLVVVIDTMSRAVAGPENEADTFRAFYNHTGLRLKKAGVTWVRLDHAGKDIEKEMRGSSAKGDDVDVVWLLSPMEGGVDLKRIRARMSWVPEKTSFDRMDEPTLEYVQTVEVWPVGTLEAAADLEELQVPVEVSVSKAAKALKEASKGRRTSIVNAAIRYRKKGLGLKWGSSQKPANCDRETLRETRETVRETFRETDAENRSEQVGNVWETVGNATPGEWETLPPPFRGGSFPPQTAAEKGGDTPWRIEL